MISIPARRADQARRRWPSRPTIGAAGVVTFVVSLFWVGIPTISSSVPPLNHGSDLFTVTAGSGLVVPEGARPAVTPSPAGPTIATHPALLSAAPVAGPAPVRIVIPRLDVSAAVAAVSVGPDQQLAVPPTTTVAAWYGDGPVPGAPGSAVIAAHVDFNGKPGVFIQLDQLDAGDQIIVIDAAGRWHTFVVQTRAEYAKSALPTAQIFAKTGPPTLTLVTCGGEFRPARHSYADNIVVSATPTN